MNRPSFQVGSKVKVITHNYEEYTQFPSAEKTNIYGWRGEVIRISGFDNDWNYIHTPYTPENYPTNWQIDVNFVSPINDNKITTSSFRNWETELEVIQKKFIDIDYLREEDLEIGEKPDGTKLIRPANSGAFEIGDHIQITTKIDGANASIAWDKTTNKLEIFSRTNLLSPTNDLRGFYNYIKTQVEPKLHLNEFSEIVIFGEWCIPHTCQYNKEWYNKWRVYDIWDKTKGNYWNQNNVKLFCDKMGLEYIEVLYDGPFVSWDHCRSFIGKSTAYGPQQEGVVIKNQTKLDNDEVRFPKYIKIVDEKFKETMTSKKEKKPVDPSVIAAREAAAALAATVVTEARVKKIILKLVDEGILPENLEPKDMGLVMKHLPKRVYEDIAKEESEVLESLAENAGKCLAAETAKVARKIVVGD